MMEERPPSGRESIALLFDGGLVGILFIAGWVGLGSALCTLLVPAWDFFLSALLIPLLIVPLSSLRRRPWGALLAGTLVGEVLLGYLAQRPIELESPMFENFALWQITVAYVCVAAAVGLAIALMAGVLLRDLNTTGTSWQASSDEESSLLSTME